MIDIKKNSPKISIITVVYNGEKFLEETILSVINQSYENVEYIIIDGGSTDGTVDIIKKYEDRISYWVSEEDEGIYDAMNKGLKVCNGKYIGILNGDDYYTEDAVELSIKKIIETKADYSIANVKYVNSKHIMRPIYPLVDNYIYQEMPYPHVSAFISANIYEKVGYFDTSFKIAGDHDMAVRIHLSGYKACYLNQIIAELEEGGISNSLSSNKESKSVAIKNGKNTLNAYITYLKQISTVYVVRALPKNLIYFIQKIKSSRFL